MTAANLLQQAVGLLTHSPLKTLTVVAPALVLMAGIREKLELATVPDVVRGTALTLMIAGILSLAFMGFAGLGA